MLGVNFFEVFMFVKVLWRVCVPRWKIASLPLHFLSPLILHLLRNTHNSTKMAPKRPRGSYTEDDMADAISDIIENGISQYCAAQKYGIPQTTISSRLKG